MFKTVLVPIDGSENSMKALTYAVEIAKQFKAKLILINVYSLPKPTPISPAMPLAGPPTETTPPLTIEITRELIEKTKQRAQEILKRAKDEAEKKHVPVETIVKEGKPVREIVKAAEEKNVDLIVMGARGISKIKEILLGSVSHGVARKAHCPVLIVK
ncbi:universal stress protein [Candidatus Bathyarchaeota archaeon]|nr:MAG: universal stress protein [Candidatus Bathyarchaeota archaeon]